MAEVFFPLYPIAMTVPNPDGIYCPSKHRGVSWIEESRFNLYYERLFKVSLTGDISDYQEMTAYGFGFDCWYILHNPAEALQ